MSVIKNLLYRFDNFELQIPHLQLADQGITALQGPSGSGKTTLLNILIGLEKPDSFEWTFKGERLDQLSIANRRLGVVFQGYDLFPHLTAAENILLVLKARHENEKRKMMFDKLETYKKKLNLEKCWQTKAQVLSGGEKQRVAFLRAVVSNPRMLLLDEPFSALDENLRDESRHSLKLFLQEVEVPVLLVTHDSADVNMLADHVLNLDNGQIKTT